MTFPKLTDLGLAGKRVLVRADLDVPFEDEAISDDSRIANCIPTFKSVLEGGAASLLILGHIGKYEGADKTVSTAFLRPKLATLLDEEVTFVPGMLPENLPNARIILLDNVRLDTREEENNQQFAEELSRLADIYINEAFATAHRAHASIVGVPKILPHAAGLRFAMEVEKLSGILENPKRPLLIIVSGIKKDKIEYMENFKQIADKILVGGRLPEYLGDEYKDDKVILGKLNPDREDITLKSIELFEHEIASAGTIILAGVIGKYEDPGQRLGTTRVFKAIADSTAFKLVGGGDSEAALTLLGLKDKFDWISTGGGAMLEFLTKKTLPGIEALK